MKICAFDVETFGSVPQFECGAIHSDMGASFHVRSHDLIDNLYLHAREGYTLFAHNAEYDATVALWNAGQDLTIHYVNDHYDCGYWDYGNPRRACQIWDTVKLSGGMSLAELGDAIGMPKLPVSYRRLKKVDDTWAWRCDRHDAPDCLQCYCERDAHIVYAWASSLREYAESQGGKLKKSLASMAVDMWQRWDPGSAQVVADRRVKALARDAYHGGRCEVFRYGYARNVQVDDFRMFYAHILDEIDLPDCRSLHYTEGDDVPNRWLEGLGCVEATVNIPPQYIPALPVASGDRVYYPVGVVRGAWPIQELARAVSYGTTILHVHRLAHTFDSVRPFATTAPALIELRRAYERANDPRSLIAKSFVNSLPGRLGMSNAHDRRMFRRWRPGMLRADVSGYELESGRHDAYLTKSYTVDRPSSTANVVWAATITGEGRSRLWTLLSIFGRSAIYCDTDSVHSMASMDDAAGALGADMKTSTWDTGLYLGPKLYRLEGVGGALEVRAKGIPAKYAEEYIREGRVRYPTTLGVANALQLDRPAATWIDVDRIQRTGPGARTILDPTVLDSQDRQSDTSPVVFVPDGTAGFALSNEVIEFE